MSLRCVASGTPRVRRTPWRRPTAMSPATKRAVTMWRPTATTSTVPARGGTRTTRCAGTYGASVGDDWAALVHACRGSNESPRPWTPWPSTDDLKAVLSDGDAGVCMYPGRWRDDGFTFGSVVMELGSPPSVQIAPGPPDRTPYVDVPFA